MWNVKPQFWRHVVKGIPDYELRKAWLAERGVEVDGLDDPADQDEGFEAGL